LHEGDVIAIGPYALVFRSPIDQSGDAIAPPDDPVPVVAVEDLEPLTIPPIPSRRVDEVLPPPGSAVSRYLEFLPLAFQKSDENGHLKDPNDFLSRFLQIFETIWEPLEQRQDHIAMFFSPRTCPASWTPWLASWLGVSIDPLLPEARARAVIMNTMWIYQRRGTRAAMVRAIEVHLGLQPEIIERADEPNVFRVRVKLPKDSAADLLPALRELVLSEKPAHMGFVIEVKP
jgi:phage tail-like protein